MFQKYRPDMLAKCYWSGSEVCGQVLVYFMISSEFLSLPLDAGVCLVHKTACLN